MSKLFRVEAYIIDMNDQIDDPEYLIENLIGERGHLVEVTDIGESDYFEWNDSLKINHTNDARNDYDEYF